MKTSLLPLLLLAALHATAGAASTASIAACNAGPETLLAGTPTGAGEARAAWLDAHHLRWAGVSAGDGPIRLLFSRGGGLSLFAGEPARGADAAVTLEAVDALPDTPALRRFSHIGPGVTLAVPAAERARLRDWHRGQLMLVQLDAHGSVRRASAVQAAGALDDLYAAAETVPELGAVPRVRQTTFRLWAPTAQRVALCLYRRGQGRAESMLSMQRDERTGVWSARVPRNLAGRHYAYAVEVFVRGKGQVRNLVTDPYSLSLTTDSQRSYVADLDSPRLQPPGWRDTPLPRRVVHAVDMVVYELHVRDFSIGDRTVPPSQRGKYLAFTQSNSNGMQHLQRLSQAGVTDVHLLPVFDLASIPERGCSAPVVPAAAASDSRAQQAAVMKQAAADCFNWGYDPWHYSAPEGSYASDAADGATRIRELRAMVQALHRIGLRVGMDVVYNHTSASGQHPRSVLDRIVPGYYHRLDAKGAVERSTCCDNTATEHRMMARLMIDSAVVWARDYGIDGFRFDLMGHQPREAMERLQRAVDAAAGRHIHLIGEGWNYGEVKDGARFEQAAQRSLNGSGIGTFNDRIRDGARGGLDSDAGPGFIHGSGDARALSLVRAGLAGTLIGGPRADYNGQAAGYASQPAEVVNYVENHDNQTLFDSNAMKLPIDTTREERVRVQVLGAAVVLLSQGVAYLHAGQEILRSKSLDRNSYDSGDWFNRLDWTLQDNGFGAGLPPARDNQALWPAMQRLLARANRIKPTPADIAATRDAVLDLLRIRASSSLFRLRTAQDVARRLTFPDVAVGTNVIVGHLDGTGLPDANFRELLYVINAEAAPHTVILDAMKGRPFALHPAHARIAASAANGVFSVPARTAAVFVLE